MNRTQESIFAGFLTRRFNVTYEELWPDEKKYTYVSFSLLMTVCGVIGNALVIAAPFLHKVLLTPGNIFIINLAIADMMISAISNPLTLFALFKGPQWFYGKPILCNFLGDLCVTSCGASLLNIFFIAINRYIAICHHQYYTRIYQFRTTIPAAVFIWITALGITFINTKTGLSENIFDEYALICTTDLHLDPPVFNFIFIFVFLMTPVIATAVLYTKLFLYVRQAKKNAGVSANSTQSADIKLAKTLGITFVAFVACWTLYVLLGLFDYKTRWGDWTWMFNVILAHGSSSGVNPVIYGLTNTNFKRGYIKVVKKIFGVCCKNCWENKIEDSLASTSKGRSVNGTASTNLGHSMTGQMPNVE